MAVYGAYHRDARNRATHFVGVPLIMLAVLIPLSWPGLSAFGLRFTGAMLALAALLVYYFLLNAALAAAVGVISGVLLAIAHWIALSQPQATGWTVFAACFIGGWTLQIVGHAYEGRSPALVDNLWQILVAPVFLTAEIFFALGFKHDIRERIKSRGMDP